MKKRVLRELLKERDENGNRIEILSMGKPEIIPFDEGGLGIDEYGDPIAVRIKPKRTRKTKGDK